MDKWCCCTLSGFSVRAPDLPFSVKMFLIGNFCTAGTNVKVESFDGTPMETCRTERRGANHSYSMGEHAESSIKRLILN